MIRNSIQNKKLFKGKIIESIDDYPELFASLPDFSMKHFKPRSAFTNYLASELF